MSRAKSTTIVSCSFVLQVRQSRKLRLRKTERFTDTVKKWAGQIDRVTSLEMPDVTWRNFELLSEPTPVPVLLPAGPSNGVPEWLCLNELCHTFFLIACSLMQSECHPPSRHLVACRPIAADTYRSNRDLRGKKPQNHAPPRLRDRPSLSECIEGRNRTTRYASARVRPFLLGRACR